MSDVENVGGIGIELRITDGTEGQISEIEGRLKTLVEPKAIPVYLQAHGFKAVEDKLQALADKMANVGGGSGSSNPQNDMDTQVARAFNTGIDKFTTALANIQIAIQPESIAAIGRIISEAFGEARTTDARGPKGGPIGFRSATDRRDDPRADARAVAGDTTVRYWNAKTYADGMAQGARRASGTPAHTGTAEPAGRPKRPIDDIFDKLREIAGNPNQPREPRVRALFSALRKPGGEDLLRETVAPGGPWDWYKGRRSAAFRGAGFGTPSSAPLGPAHLDARTRARNESPIPHGAATAQATIAAEPEPTITCPDCGQAGIKPRGMATHKRVSPRHKPPAAATPRAPRAAEPIPPSAPGQWQRQANTETQAVREKDELTGEYLIQADPKGRKTGRYRGKAPNIENQRRVEGRTRGRLVTLAKESWFDISRPLPKLAGGRAPTLDEIGAVNQAGYQRTVGVSSLMAGQFEDQTLQIPSLDSQTGRAPGLPRYRYSYWPGRTIGGGTYSPRDAMLSGRLRQLAAARAAGAEPERIAELERRARGRIRVLTRGLPRDTRMQMSRRILADMVPGRELDLVDPSRGAFGMGQGTIQARLALESQHQARVVGARRGQAQAQRPELTAEAHQLAQSYVESGKTLNYRSPGVPRRVAGTGKEYQGAERAQLEFPAVLRGGGDLARTFRRVLEESRTGQIGPAYRLLTPEAVAPMVPGPESLAKKTGRLGLLRMPVRGPGSELLQSVLGSRFGDLSKKLAPTVQAGPLKGQGLYRLSTAERIREELVDRLGLESADELTSEKNPELHALYLQFETFRRSLPQSKQRLATEGMAVWQRGPTFAREEMPYTANIYNRQGKLLRSARIHRDRMRAGGPRSARTRDARAWNRYKIQEGLLQGGGRLGRLDLTGRGLDMPNLTGPDVTYAQNIRERVQQGKDLPFADEAVNKALNMLALYKLGPVDTRKRPEDKLLPEVSAGDIGEYLYGRNIRSGETQESFDKRGGYQAGLIDILGKPSQLVQRATGIRGRGFGMAAKDRRRLAPMASTLFQAIRHEVDVVRGYRTKDESGRQGRAERAAGFVAPMAPGKYTGWGIPKAEADLYSISHHPAAGRLQRAQDVLILKAVEAANLEEATTVKFGKKEDTQPREYTSTGADLSSETPGRGPTIRRAMRPAPGFLTGRGLPTTKAAAKKKARRGRPVGEPIEKGLTEEERARTIAQDRAEVQAALIEVARPMDEVAFRSLPGGIGEQRAVAAEAAIARQKLLTRRAMALPAQGRRARRTELRLRRHKTELDQALEGTFAPIAKPAAPIVETAAAAAAGGPPPAAPVSTTAATAASGPPPTAPTPPVAAAAAGGPSGVTPPPQSPDPRSFLRSDGVIRVFVVDGKIKVYGSAVSAATRAEKPAASTGGPTAKQPTAPAAPAAQAAKPKTEPRGPEGATTAPAPGDGRVRPGPRHAGPARVGPGASPTSPPETAQMAVEANKEVQRERIESKHRRLGARSGYKRLPSPEEVAKKLAAEKEKAGPHSIDDYVEQEATARLAAERVRRLNENISPYSGDRGPTPMASPKRRLAQLREEVRAGFTSNFQSQAKGMLDSGMPRSRIQGILVESIEREFPRVSHQESQRLAKQITSGPEYQSTGTRTRGGTAETKAAPEQTLLQDIDKFLGQYGYGKPQPVSKTGQQVPSGLKLGLNEEGEALSLDDYISGMRASRQAAEKSLPMRALSTSAIQTVGTLFGPYESVRKKALEAGKKERAFLQQADKLGEMEEERKVRLPRLQAVRARAEEDIVAGKPGGQVAWDTATANISKLNKQYGDQIKVVDESREAYETANAGVVTAGDAMKHFGASFAGGVAGGVIGAVAGMLAQPLIQSIAMVVDKIGGPIADQMLGFTVTRQRTMGELAQATEAAGGIGSVAFAQKYQFAPESVTANLAPEMVGQAETISASKQLEAIRDAFRSTQGMGDVPSALYTSQGPLGNPFLADYKSITELISSGVVKPEEKWRTPDSSERANKWFDQVVNPVLAEEGKYTFRRGDKEELAASKAGMEAVGWYDVNAEGFVAVDTATGKVVTSFEDLARVAASVSSSFTRIDPDQYIAQNRPQWRAQIEGAQLQTQLQVDTINPIQRYMDYITNPPLAFGTGVMPDLTGSASKFMPAMGYDAQKGMTEFPGVTPAALQSFSNLEAAANESRAAIKAMAVEGRAELERLNVPTGTIDRIASIGEEIAAAQTKIGGIQANLNWTRYNHDVAIAKRGVTDMLQLTGKMGRANGDNVGYYERQLLLINRASTALSLQLQQRQITTQQAIAGFAVQGDTPEIRMARRKEAMLEAEIAQKQLGYSKQAFGTEIKLVDAQNLRGLQEAMYSLADLQRSFSAQNEIALLQDFINTKQREMQLLVPDAAAWIGLKTGYESMMISIAQDLAAKTDAAVADVLGQKIMPAIVDLLSMLPAWLGGGGPVADTLGLPGRGTRSSGPTNTTPSNSYGSLSIPGVSSSSTTDARSYKVENKPVFNIEVKNLDEETVADLTTKVVKSINTALALVGIRPVAR